MKKIVFSFRRRLELEFELVFVLYAISCCYHRDCVDAVVASFKLNGKIVFPRFLSPTLVFDVM